MVTVPAEIAAQQIAAQEKIVQDETERRAMVIEYNGLRSQIGKLRRKLERMEAHEGDDGTPEDIDGQCRLVDEIGVMQRRIDELQRTLYPKFYAAVDQTRSQR